MAQAGGPARRRGGGPSIRDMQSGSAPPPQQLSREVLRWLQGLDLAYSVRNMRRDFSNGFLAAEIFSRYFPSHFQMHAFENGLSQVKKANNWNLSRKLFAKVGFVLLDEQATIDGLMASDSDAVLSFINQAYTFLTTREVRPEVAKKLFGADASRELKAGAPPPGALAGTAASLDGPGQVSVSLAHSKMDGQEDFAASVADGQRSEVLSQNSSSLRAPSKVLRGENRRVGPGISSVHVKTGGVNIKPLEADVARLRSEREGVQTSLLQGSLLDESKSSHESAEAKTSEDGSTSSREREGAPNGALKFFEEVMSKSLGTQSGFTTSSLLSELRELKAADDSVLSEQDISRLFMNLSEGVDCLARLAFETPAEFSLVVTAVCHTMVSLRNSAASKVLLELGERIAGRSRQTARAMFFDFVLPELRHGMASSHYNTRARAAAVFAAFCPQDAKASSRAVHELSKRLECPRTFLLTMIALFELLVDPTSGEGFECVREPGTGLSQLLLQAALRGVGQQSPTVRAAAVCVLRHLVRAMAFHQPHEGKDADREEKLAPESNHERTLVVVRAAFVGVKPLVRDTWWESRTQVGLFAVQVITSLPSNGEEVAAAVDLLARILSSAEHRSIPQATALCAAVAPHVARHLALIGPFSRSLLSLDSADARQELLGERGRVDLAVQCQSLAGENLRQLGETFRVDDFIDWVADGEYSPGRLFKVAEVEVLAWMLERWTQRSDFSSEDSMQLTERVFDAIAEPLFRTMDVIKKRPNTFAIVVSLLFETFVGSCQFNVFLHPIWPDVLFKLYGFAPASDEQRESIEALSSAFRSILIAGDDGIRASVKALMEETLQKYPTLERALDF